MTRITTPFDSFLSDLATWIDGAWFVLLALGLSVVLAIVVVAISRARARARARIPQYRRQRQS